ncbi:hypothetical protein AV530_017431 [Patagioenas fasciata monilis]|uniref:Uncharacterized protein n=1 Tax=Patagioenas fasciata monilis TaxID=372326 RepID=A0A1V4JG46_PATFA|nr:hypothetical protein AV530_017431 [Patagioenas fasciata monilis]
MRCEYGCLHPQGEEGEEAFTSLSIRGGSDAFPEEALSKVQRVASQADQNRAWEGLESPHEAKQPWVTTLDIIPPSTVSKGLQLCLLCCYEDRECFTHEK